MREDVAVMYRLIAGLKAKQKANPTKPRQRQIARARAEAARRQGIWSV